MKKIVVFLITAILCMSFASVAFAGETVIETETDPVLTLADACKHTAEADSTLEKHDAIPATCTDAGCAEYWVCKECNEAFSAQSDSAKIADLKAWTSEGGDGYIAPLGHDYKSVDTTKATCTKDGVRTYTCTRCGDSYTEVIKHTGHVMNGDTCVNCGTKEGVIFKDGAWVYAIGDEIQTGYTGIKPNEYGWWRIVNGKVDFDCTSVEANEFGWWYIEGGKVRFDYTGIKPNQYGWWCIVNGAVDFGFTGLMPNEAGWWYIENGKVQFDYTGIRPNEYGWWRIVNGRVDFDCTSVEQNEYGWWYIENGCVRFDYTGIKQNAAGWWRIEAGQVNFDYTGLAENEYGWWYCLNGMVDFSYTGFVEYYGAWWYVEAGQLRFDKVGMVNGTINGLTKGYFVSGGMVNFGADPDAITAAAQSYYSSTGWLILVDCNANVFTVFSGSQWNWKLEHFWPCTTGAGDTKTPKGVNQVGYKLWGFSGPDELKEPYNYWNAYTVYYATNYKSGGYFIHSTLYHYGSYDDLDPTLGASLSHGCIRLAFENAKWIYYNIPYGTTVVTY